MPLNAGVVGSWLRSLDWSSCSPASWIGDPRLLWIRRNTSGSIWPAAGPGEAARNPSTNNWSTTRTTAVRRRSFMRGNPLSFHFWFEGSDSFRAPPRQPRCGCVRRDVRRRKSCLFRELGQSWSRRSPLCQRNQDPRAHRILEHRRGAHPARSCLGPV